MHAPILVKFALHCDDEVFRLERLNNAISGSCRHM